jgi:hypothetical protein
MTIDDYAVKSQAPSLVKQHMALEHMALWLENAAAWHSYQVLSNTRRQDSAKQKKTHDTRCLLKELISPPSLNVTRKKDLNWRSRSSS